MDLAMQQIKENTFLKEKDKLLGFIRIHVSTVEVVEDIHQDVFFLICFTFQYHWVAR